MKKDKSNRFKFLKILSDYTTEHWIVSSVILLSASWVYSIIITFWGEKLYLIKVADNGDKSLTWLGVLILLITFLILLLNSIISKYKKELPNDLEIDLNHMTAGYNLFDKVLSGLSNVCKKKHSTQMSIIHAVKESNQTPPIVYSKPCEQLETILDEMCECLAFLLTTKNNKFTKDSIYASIAYNFPQENKEVWKWTNVRQEKGLKISELLKEGTTFHYLMEKPNGSMPYVFFNSKEAAYKDSKYLPDDWDVKDKDNNLLGSIACFRINLKRGDVIYVSAVLSISTYDKPFVKIDDNNSETEEVITVRDNVKNIVIAEYAERIKVELCNYYLQFLRREFEGKTPSSIK